MTSDRSDGPTSALGFGYAQFQLAKALVSSEHHVDPEVRARAEARSERWLRILEHFRGGTAQYGSRTPFEEVPAWVTLEVATGGFATGGLLAGGELTAYERELSQRATGVRADQTRLDLNLWHLTDDGLSHLRQLLADGRYRVDVPEEAALPVVAWLVSQGQIEQSQAIIEAIAPFFDRLRFFPAHTDDASPLTAEVSAFTAGDVRKRLSGLKGQRQLAEQKRAISIRLPLYDATISLFLATYVDGWPCRRYPEGWHASAKALLTQIDSAKDRFRSEVSRKNDRASELFRLLATCSDDSDNLTGRQVGRIRRIVDDFVTAHGRPESPRHVAFRQRQQRDVSSAAHHRIGHAVAARLAGYPESEGIGDVSTLTYSITESEAVEYELEPGQTLPDAIRRRLERCRRGTIAELVDVGIVTSGDTIARLLPALTAEIRSNELADPDLRRLYALTYRAFRSRRSLLLLNLERQVRLKELPWVAAVDGNREPDAASAESARLALTESARVAIEAFPHAITPNKLVSEFRALAAGAKLKLPFVDEIAADIFMGEFTNTFIEASRSAARVVAGTLYANYYDIDTDTLAVLPDKRKARTGHALWRRSTEGPDALSKLAVKRAGAKSADSSTAMNGAILEQSQILTTHNLAVLFDGAGLRPLLDAPLDAMALRCFQWICKRQQMRIPHWHGRLIMLKNTAYAWRQMIFFLSMLGDARRHAAITRIEEHFREQPETFRLRFGPAMMGLHQAEAGRRLPQHTPGVDGARVFRGWTTARHWLLS
jgi:hypothetical protein